MSVLDLDLIAKEPIKIKFKGETYELREPNVEQHIKHGELLDQMEDLRYELAALENKPDAEELLKAKLKEFRKLTRNFDERVISIFLPKLGIRYRELTDTQRNKILELIFNSEKKTDEPESQTKDSKEAM